MFESVQIPGTLWNPQKHNFLYMRINFLHDKGDGKTTIIQYKSANPNRQLPKNFHGISWQGSPFQIQKKE